jgi:c-di-GMP-binding flagellar brake protein YcgR
MSDKDQLEKQEKSRREDVRTVTRIPLTFHCEGIGDFEGSIVDLSAGGMALETHAKLKKGDIVTFRYAFRTLERPFWTKVVRIRKKEKEEEPGSENVYGCKFVDLTNGGETAIRNYVFDQIRRDTYKQELEIQQQVKDSYRKRT